MRKSLSAAIGATVMAGSVLVAGPAHATSGGGCADPTSNGNGTVVSACISVSGNELRADFYVNQLGRCGSFGIYIYDISNGRNHAGSWQSSCRTGRHGYWSAGLVRNNKYKTVVILNVNNFPAGRWDSKEQIA